MARTDIDALVLQLSADVRKLERSMERAVAKTNQTAGQIEKRFDKMSSNVGATGERMGRLLGASLGAVGVAAAIREVQEYADAWRTAGNKLSAAGVPLGALADTQARLVDLSIKTRTGLDATVDLYARLTRSTESLGTSQQDLFRATEILNKGFKAGGASVSEQTAAIMQLGQALGSGVLQGDELRSLRENAPLVAKAIAEEFGTTVAGLKQLGAEGKLQTDRIFTAILASGAAIDAQFKTTGATVGEAFGNIQTAVTAAIGRLDEMYGVSALIADKLNEVADLLGKGGDGGPQTFYALNKRNERFTTQTETIRDQAAAYLEESGSVRELSKEELKLATARKKAFLDRLRAQVAEAQNLRGFNKTLAQRTVAEQGSINRALFGDVGKKRDVTDANKQASDLVDTWTELENTLLRIDALDVSVFAADAGAESGGDAETVKSKLKAYTTDLEDFNATLKEVRASQEGAAVKSRAVVQALIDYGNAAGSAEQALRQIPSVAEILLADDLPLLKTELAKIADPLTDGIYEAQAALYDLIHGVDTSDPLAGLLPDDWAEKLQPEIDEAGLRFRETMRASFKDALRQGIETDDWGTALRSILADAIAGGFDDALNRVSDYFMDVLFGSGAPGASKGILAALFSGGRANGGPVNSGSMYKINEAGRGEFLFTGGKSGQMMNMSQMQKALGGGRGGPSSIDARLIVQGSIDAATWPDVRAAMQQQAQTILQTVPGVVTSTMSDHRVHKRRF